MTGGAKDAAPARTGAAGSGTCPSESRHMHELGVHVVRKSVRERSSRLLRWPRRGAGANGPKGTRSRSSCLQDLAAGDGDLGVRRSEFVQALVDQRLQKFLWRKSRVSVHIKASEEGGGSRASTRRLDETRAPEVIVTTSLARTLVRSDTVFSAWSTTRASFDVSTWEEKVRQPVEFRFTHTPHTRTRHTRGQQLVESTSVRSAGQMSSTYREMVRDP